MRAHDLGASLRTGGGLVFSWEGAVIPYSARERRSQNARLLAYLVLNLWGMAVVVGLTLYLGAR